MNPLPAQPSKALSVSLWSAQCLLALVFVGTAFWKLLIPIENLAQMIPWAGEHATLLVVTAGFDLFGGVGVLLPTLTGVKPRLAGVAAVGCTLLQGAAIVFHFSRGEGANTPFNFFLVALSLFVAWGRQRAPLRTL